MATKKAVRGAAPRLAATDLRSGYGKHAVLHGVSLTVDPGEIVTILGHNGAGKTTLLTTLFGAIPVEQGVIVYRGDNITDSSAVSRVQAGISYTPATSAIFRNLTVRQNLELGGFTVRDGQVRAERLARVHELFPVLRDRSTSVAGRLSGGQQRLLSIGIALMSGAELMLLDEPSLGIAPGLVAELFHTIKELAIKTGLSVILVEQNVRAALPIADHVYYLRTGEIILDESADRARERDDWWSLF